MKRLLSLSAFTFSIIVFTNVILAQSQDQIRDKKQITDRITFNGTQTRTNWVDADGDGICDNFLNASQFRNANFNRFHRGRLNKDNILNSKSGVYTKFGNGTGLHPQDGTGLGFKYGSGTGTGVCDGTGPKGKGRNR